jgi:hypothetical protein
MTDTQSDEKDRLESERANLMRALQGGLSDPFIGVRIDAIDARLQEIADAAGAQS